MSIYDVRLGVLLGLAYVLCVLLFYAGFAVGRAEWNLREMERIASGYGVRE